MPRASVPTTVTTPTALAAVTAPSTAAAVSGELTVVDQTAGPDPGRVALFQNIVAYAPEGQEFTPSLPALDTVELLVSTRSCEPSPRLQVSIREATIRGTLVGQSEPFAPANNRYRGVAYFHFPALVRLTPGSLYVVEVADVSGKAPQCVESLVGVTDLNPYPRGRQILSGEPQPNEDLFFREGLARATPPSADYCREGLWQHLSRPDGRAFQSEDDCVRYANTAQ